MTLRWKLLILLAIVQVSFALFGVETDPQASLKAAIANRERQREEMLGYFEKNQTKMGNWTLVRCPFILMPS